MKSKSLYLLFFLMVLDIHASHAQFLKKLKEKVNKTVGKTVGSGDTNANGDNSQSSAATQTGQVGQVNFAKYNITTSPAIDPSAIKERYNQFQDQYASYNVINNDIVAQAILYAGDQQSEGGGYTGNTAAYIFENGKLIQRTSIDEIENKKNALDEAYKRYDWPYNYTKDDINPMKAIQSVLGSNAQFSPTGFIESKDKSRFYAIVGLMGQGDDIPYYLLSFGGKKIKLPSAASGLITNIDFSQAAVFGFIKTFEENEKNNSNVLQAAGNTLNQSDIYFMDGRIIKSASNIAAGGNAWLDPSGNNYLTADENFGAYINGKKIVDKGPNSGHVWCNSKASSWCWFNDAGEKSGHLVFSDGADVPNAIHPVQIILNGKNYMVWFSYKNVTDGELLLCKKEL